MPARIPLRAFGAAVVVAVALPLTACGAGVPVEPVAPVTRAAGTDVVYVGRSSSTAHVVAVTVRGGLATGYVCDPAGTAVWLQGIATGGALDLRGEDGTALVGAVHGLVVHGGVTSPTPPGWSFAAVSAREPAGLYEAGAQGGAGRIGWVRLPDGEVCGVADLGGVDRPAPAPAPGIEIDGVRFDPPRRVASDTDS